jgi:serine/threonine protein kinase
MSYIKKHYQELTWSHVIRLSLDIAKALQELHRKVNFGISCYYHYIHKLTFFIIQDLIHRDLHSGNILNHVTCYGITWTWLADLGLCMKEDVARQMMNDGKLYGKIGYMAPEVLRGKPYTKAADVYSFGIILWELTSCQVPYSNVLVQDPISLIVEITEGKRRPEIVEDTPPAFSKLIQDCWNPDPMLRPTMEEVYKKIWSFSNSMINGNRKDKYGFKAAEINRSLRLSTMTTEQVYPQVIRNQMLQIPNYVGKFLILFSEVFDDRFVNLFVQYINIYIFNRS